MVGWMIVYYVPTYWELSHVTVSMSVNYNGPEFGNEVEENEKWALCDGNNNKNSISDIA